LAQALALIPGTSRSGATIIGGLFFGLSRRAATEFSFFLAMPTLIGASIYQLYKERALLSFDDLGMWVVGFVASFISAFWAVRGLLRYISTHDFSIFAWYRIAFGIVVLVTWHYDVISWASLSMAARILYLHGFCSSPASWKARCWRERLAAAGLGDRFVLPDAVAVPLTASPRVEALLAVPTRPTTLVGSSLGGYYATWLAEKHDLRAVLINPAVMAPELLGGLVGQHSQLSQRRDLRVHARARRQLRALEAPRSPRRATCCWSRPATRCSTTGWPSRAMPAAARWSRRGRSQLHALPRAGTANH
jgi:predicted esterase YcpF (UPF0227 family)